MTATPTELRADLYRLLDKVIASGEPFLVRRGDSTVRIALVAAARGLQWTRDPFDRLIVGSALAQGAHLVTCDERILANYRLAIWE